MWSALQRHKVKPEVLTSVAASEDALTSVVFDALRFPETAPGLVPFLARAEAYEGNPLAAWLSRPGIEAKLQLWPRWREHVVEGRREPLFEELRTGEESPNGSKEPDVFVRFIDPEGGREGWLVIEAKLYSDKSNAAAEVDVPGDQLGRQWWHLVRRAARAGAEPLGIVFLTAHLSMPHAAFVETKQELQSKAHAPAPLYWLSWRDFVSSVEASPDAPDALRDVARLVMELWGQYPIRFEPWRTPPTLPDRWSAGFHWAPPPTLPALWRPAPTENVR